MSNPILEIKNFTQTYNDFVAVKDLSLTVNEGEIYGFIGHNGAGKSTTIKSIVGILPVEVGEIYVDGHLVSNERKLCQSLCAYIPDNPDLYGYMTGIGYINFVCDLYQVPLDIRVQRTEYLSDAFGITEHLSDVISSYSHGMKQQIAIIAALAHDPKLLVLDEPFVGLDPYASATLKRLMKEHCQKGNAIFFSTHVLEVAQVLCDEIAMLDHGKLIVSGNVKKLTENQTLEELFLEKVGQSHD